jgi:hypothetical protein
MEAGGETDQRDSIRLDEAENALGQCDAVARERQPDELPRRDPATHGFELWKPERAGPLGPTLRVAMLVD